MTSLDFSHIPKNEFTISRCVEVYEDWIADNQCIPEKIYVRAYQANILASHRAFGLRTETWRGIPLEIK